MEELEKYYNYLKSNGADVPPNYNSFKTTLSDSNNAKQYYSYLQKNKFDVAPSYESFSKTFSLGQPATPLPSAQQQMPNIGIQPVGTYHQSQSQPQKDLITQMKEQAKVEDGVPTIHDNHVAKSNKPDIKEAIDHAVIERNKQFGVLDKPNMNFGRDEITKKYKDGDLALDFDGEGKSVLKKTTSGLFDSFVNAVNKASIERADNANLSSLDTEGKIKYLEAKKVLDAQDDKVAGNKVLGFNLGNTVGKVLNKTTEFGGENADMLTKTAAGAMTGGALAPELIGAGHLGGFLATVKDFATGGGSNLVTKTYYDLKQQGLSDHEAMKKAEKAEPLGAATGIATGAILAGLPKLNADREVVHDFLNHLIKSSGKMGAVSGAEAGVNDAAEMGVGVHKSAGDVVKDIGENAARGVGTALAFETLLNIHKVPAAIYNQARKVISSIPEGVRDEFINNSVLSGELPKEKAEEIKAAVIRPEEMNKPETVTIAPKENIPEEKRGAAVILPENNKPIEAVHIGGKEYDAPQESNRAAVVMPENNTSPNIVELKKNEQNEGLSNNETITENNVADKPIAAEEKSSVDTAARKKDEAAKEETVNYTPVKSHKELNDGDLVVYNSKIHGDDVYKVVNKKGDKFDLANVKRPNNSIRSAEISDAEFKGKYDAREKTDKQIVGNDTPSIEVGLKKDVVDAANEIKQAENARAEQILRDQKNDAINKQQNEEPTTKATSQATEKIELPQEGRTETSGDSLPNKTTGKEEGSVGKIENFTPVDVINEGRKKLVAKIGEKKTSKYFEQVHRLVDPNQNEVVEYRTNGVVVKQGEKYIFKPLADMDMKNWRIGKINDKVADVTDQFVKKASEENLLLKPLPPKIPQPENLPDDTKSDLTTVGKAADDIIKELSKEEIAHIKEIGKDSFNKLRQHVVIKQGSHDYDPHHTTAITNKIIEKVSGKSDNRTTTSSPDKVVQTETPKTEVSGNEKPLPESADEVGRGDAKVTATDVKKPTTKVSSGLRAAAKKLREGELPSFLKSDLPEGTQKAGFGGKELQEAVAKGLETVADLIDSGAELAKATEEGFKHIQDHYKENGAKFKDEAAVKKQFEDFVNENLGGVEPIGITHAATDKLAEELGLPDRYEKDPTTRERQDAEAVKRIANGEMPALIEKLKNKEMPSDIEQRMMAHHLGELKAEYENTKSDKLLLEIKNLKELSDIVGGREVGKSLQARQENITHPLDDGEASVKVAHMEALGVNELTDKQKAEYKKQINEYKAIAENEKIKREAVEKKYKDFLAKKAVDKVKKEASFTERKPKTKTEFVSERKAIIDSIKDKWKKSANDGTLTAVPIPYAKQLMAIAPDVAKLVRSLVEEAMDITLPDLVKKVHDIVKEGVPELTEKDVHDIIAGEYNEKKDTKNELQAKIYELRQEAKLLNEYDRILRQEPATEKKKVVRNAKLAELRKQIKTLLDGEPDEIATKIKNTLKANERTAQKYIERIKNGDFENAPKIPFEENFEFKQQHPALFQAAMDAIQKKKDAKTAFDIALEKDKISKENGLLKTYRFLGKAKNTLQSMVAGVDDSLMFVQLGYTLVNNPSVAINFRKYTDANGKTKFALGGSIKEHILDAVSKKRFETQMAVLHNSSYWPLIKASGLDVLEPMSLLDRQKEEMFQHNLAEYVGTKKVNLGKFLAIWERAYTSLGNNTRVNLFMRQAKVLYEKGMTIENNLEEFKGLATAINNLTGRGSTSSKIAQVIPYVTPVIWSPKMIASSINLLGISDIVTGGQAGFYTKLPPKARAYAARQMAEGFSIAGGLMLAAALGGHTVHYNPHDPRFGDIEFGEDGSKAINVFGRYGSMMRLVVQLWPAFLGGGRMNSKGITEDVGEEGGKTRGQVAGGFLRGKMNPVSGLAFDYLLNDKKGYYDKKPLTLAQSAKDLTIPMSLRDVRKEMDRDGTISIFNYDLPSFVGMSMKDQRDYYSNQTNDKTIDSFLEKNKLKLTSTTSVTIPKDDKHPLGKPTDDEMEKFSKVKGKIVEDGIKQLMKTGWATGEEEVKPTNKLTPDELKGAIKYITDHATDKAKEEVFGKVEKDKAVEHDKRRNSKINQQILSGQY